MHRKLDNNREMKLIFSILIPLPLAKLTSLNVIPLSCILQIALKVLPNSRKIETVKNLINLYFRSNLAKINKIKIMKMEKMT